MEGLRLGFRAPLSFLPSFSIKGIDKCNFLAYYLNLTAKTKKGEF